MSSRVTVVYANEEPPEAWDASLFIAGPMPRTTDVPSWRPEALKAVESAWQSAGELVVFVPEPRNGKPLKYDHHTWEDRWLAIVDVILFWVPRNMQNMPGLTTNVEFGRWESSGRVVLGTPPNAAHVGYLRECAIRNGAPVTATLNEAAAAAMEMISNGSRRNGAECQVPLSVWNHVQFQSWLSERRQKGRTLMGARVLWIQHNVDRTRLRWVLEARFIVGGQDAFSEVVAFGDIGIFSAPEETRPARL
ncbi:nucleoside 2-deoxyribosyltransferase domain-containing protein [Actinoplanes flavus]|uniref:Nucleoside 2-deoxyribosyltransferase like n=1 Tax=Actinoplanes flavus TaxID=2820290 RepID=A0ABS3UGU6_9ACTN|nr:nucleoside 2-deoxyribosyltransferase domain-containing protein [Actinoplanes flavus]MBO3737992.1 hypothetical protein [Actinoplanes flavus]